MIAAFSMENNSMIYRIRILALLNRSGSLASSFFRDQLKTGSDDTIYTKGTESAFKSLNIRRNLSRGAKSEEIIHGIPRSPGNLLSGGRYPDGRTGSGSDAPAF